MFRKTIFWIHLVSGVVAGLVVLMMSVTGVLLTYERQIISWADYRNYEPPVEEVQQLPIPALVAAATAYDPDFEASSIQIFSDPDKPVVLSAGRSGRLILDPYSGAIIGTGAQGVRDFFSLMTGWHRWFNASGDSRNTARAITGASNLMFLFLVLSGIYLWLPSIWNWASFRARLLFRRGPMTGKARDFNWHHVLGIWSAIPLAIVVATASVFYYPWANNLVYGVFGEEPPTRGGPPGSGQQAAVAEIQSLPGEVLSADALLQKASQQVDNWQSISLSLSSSPEPVASFTLDQGDGGQPQLRHTLELDSQTGEVVNWEPFSSRTPGAQARSWVRYLHTGEALGILGQTIAGLVSLASIFLVWTGLALAYRRLIVPLTNRA